MLLGHSIVGLRRRANRRLNLTLNFRSQCLAEALIQMHAAQQAHATDRCAHEIIAILEGHRGACGG
jgi:hypothetical protein